MMPDNMLMQATLMALTMQNVTGDPGGQNGVILDVYSLYFDGLVVDVDPLDWIVEDEE